MNFNRMMGPRVCFDVANEGGSGGANNSGQPGSGADKGAPPDKGSAGGANAPAWIDGLKDTGNRDLAKAKGWSDPDVAVKSYAELEGKMGKAIFIPAADADDATKSAFLDKLGRPKTPTEYKFERPKDLPTDAKYDATQAEAMKTVFHKAGLSPLQAQMLHDTIVTTAATGATARDTAAAAEATKAFEQITQKWGAADGEQFKRQNELANRTIRQMGGDELTNELKAVGVLSKDGEVRRPAVAFALAKIGETLFAEDNLYAGPTGFKNPFAAESEDRTAQGEIIKASPDRARQLIRAAGLDPAEYQL